MEALQTEIKSLADIDKEIDVVKQRIKIKEAELSNDFNSIPNQLLKTAIAPVTTGISSIIGGSLLLKAIGELKNFLSGSAENADGTAGENQSDKKSFLISSIKSIGLAGLLKLTARIIRHI